MVRRVAVEVCFWHEKSAQLFGVAMCLKTIYCFASFATINALCSSGDGIVSRLAGTLT